ncbi:unnamed protein product, partial [marine sediment metagenome]
MDKRTENKGQPTKLTPEVQAKIITAIRAGNYFNVSCRYAGISPATGLQWIQRGKGEHDREAKQIYVDFVEAVNSAKAQSEVEMVAIIRKAALDGQWPAAMTYLERAHPKRWGRIPALHSEGDGAATPPEMTISQLRTVVVSLIERRTGGPIEQIEFSQVREQQIKKINGQQNGH